MPSQFPSSFLATVFVESTPLVPSRLTYAVDRRPLIDVPHFVPERIVESLGNGSAWPRTRAGRCQGGVPMIFEKIRKI